MKYWENVTLTQTFYERCKRKLEQRHFPVQKSQFSWINSKSELLNLKTVIDYTSPL